jgi:glycosyltransferase involved in cell wall biosynthesis
VKFAFFAYPHRGGTFSVFRHLRAGLAPHGIELRWLGIGRLAHDGIRDPDWLAERAWGDVCGARDDDDKAQAISLLEAIGAGQFDGVFVNAHADPVQTNLARYLPNSLLRILIVHNITPGTYAAAAAVREHVHGVVCVSPRIEQDLIARYGFDPSMIGTIPNATDVPVAPARSLPAEAAALRILSLGRIEDQAKGVLWLPEILRRLPGHLHLTIAGDGSDLDRLRRRSSGLGDRVRFVGGVSPRGVAALLAEHELLLAPSRFEGFMITAVEAMASGCVPVVSRIRGVTDSVIDDGASGLLFPVGDLDAAARSIRALDADRQFWLRLSNQGQEQVRKRFCVDRLGRDYAERIGRLRRAPPEIAPPRDIDGWRLPAGLRAGLRTYLPTRVKNLIRTIRERAA